MAKIRLQRAGKKKAPFYHIVVADSKSPRDGRFIEQLGTYDPTKNPAAVTLKEEEIIKGVFPEEFLTLGSTFPFSIAITPT